MPIQLTERQQAAVDRRGGGLLVSAAAGSGKTKVLVQRLLDRCLGDEGADVDQFLIITYTRAAAAELRCRIAQELTDRMADAPDDRRLRRQLLRVYRADIKTIDAFCTSLVRENIHLLPDREGLSLSQDFRVLDDAEAALLRRQVLPRVLEDFYEDLTPGGAQLADSFGFGRDDRALEELVLELYDKLQCHAYPQQWLAEQMAQWRDPASGGGDGPYGRLLRRGLARKARHWAETLARSLEEARCDRALEAAYGGAFAQGMESLRALAEAAEAGWDRVSAAAPVWPRLKAARKCASPELKAMLQSRWARCKREMDAALKPFAVTDAQAEEDMARAAPAMEALGELCGAFSRAYAREKLRRNAADFSDQEHFAVQLLIGPDGQPTETARTVAGRYREVMVDEYQDTNQVQNAIFDALSDGGRRLFAVGDVKQSIYRFRLADPGIFLEKYETFPDDREAAEGEPCRVLLSRNFRSRQPVLDAVNFVFGAVMSRDMGEMDYGGDERLNFGADYLPPREDCGTEFHLIGTDAPGRPLTEARFVARRIRRLLEEGYSVTDEAGGLRPCRGSDIVVLLRSPGSRLRWYARAMEEEGIPCSTGESEDFFSNMEVAVTYSLLQILDNPRQDVPLISVLRSPVFGFTPDRLAVIRGNHPSGDFYDALAACPDQDCRDFLALLEELRLESKDMSVYRLIWRLYDRLNIPAIFGAMSGGEGRRENLVAFSQYAQRFEAAGYKGLFAFVSHLRFLLENGRQPAAAGSDGEGVRIMSIHRSKGLEFPIVILADLSHAFNREDLQAPVLVHPQLGLGPMFVDLDRRLRYPTLARRAVEAAMDREARSEEMRVLYVAMTRAKEKLILVASMKNAPRRLGDLTALSALPVPPETVAGARSMAEWILLPLLRRREAAPLRAAAGMEEGLFAPMEDTPWQVYYHGDGEEPLPAAAPADREETPPVGEETVDREALDFVYPWAAECLMPSKLTATQLKGRWADSEIAEHTAAGACAPEDFPRPRFLEGEAPLTPSQRGTATHLVMQYLPLDADPADTVADLVDRRLLTRAQGEAVDLDAIRRFLISPLVEELRRADSIQREYRFSILVPASDYFPQAAEGEELLLQGVVDLFARTAEGILVVDFKTDYVTKETLAEKAAYYRPQLTAYSAALERILGEPVVRRALYFFRTGDTVEV